MRFPGVPVHPGRTHRARKDGLAVDEAGESDRIKSAEGVERITFNAGSGCRRIDELEIEVGVVPDQDRLAAAVVFECFPNRLEDFR